MKINTIKQFLIIFFVVFVSFTDVGWCQSNLGGIAGRITDPSGAAIPEASVVLTGLDAGAILKAGTSGDGLYLVSGVPPGRYRLRVTKTGFKVFTQQPIFISTATVINLDITLTIGTVAETVNVTAAAAELQTSSAEVGTVMPNQAVRDLPILLGGTATTGASGRRQMEGFTFLTPGVSGNQWDKYVNGEPAFGQDILIDGFSATTIGAPGFVADQSPPYEAMGEFKMQNTLYPAEYGQALGLENYTLKSGGDSYHGDLFEFLRNDAEDSRGFFAQLKTPLRQNEFGATFGGPFNIPKIYNGKGRTFFFAAYSGFTLRGGIPGLSLVTIPSLLERQGNFTDYPYPIFDPVCGRGTPTAHRCSSTETRQQFSYGGTLNIIDPSLLSAVALRTTALIPSPDLPGYVNNYVNRTYQPTTENVGSIKIDHTINAKQRLSAALWIDRGSTWYHGNPAGALDDVERYTPEIANGIRVNHTYTISPTLLNHVGLGISMDQPMWAHYATDPREGNQVLQIPGIPTDAHGYPRLSFTGYTALGNANNSAYDPAILNHYSLGEDLSWVKGRHQIKVGALYSMRTFDTRDTTNQAGSFTFSNNSTSQPNNASKFGTWGNGYASFMLGEVSTAMRAIPRPEEFLTDQLFALYADDSIKVAPKVTLTLGLRYEIPIYVTERNGDMSYLSLTAPNSAAGGLPGALMFLGDGAGRAGTRNMFGHYDRSFSPRLGLAYQLNNKTVVRMGYGIFRLDTNYARLNNATNFGGGFGAYPSFSSLDNGITPPFYLDAGFPTTNIPTLPNFDPTQKNNGSIAYINGGANEPTLTQSWSAGFQHELPGNILLDAAYVGSNTTGLDTGLQNLNQVNPTYLSLGSELNANISCLTAKTCPNSIAAGVHSPYPGFTATIAQALRPFPQYTTIADMYQPTGYNTYHSMQIRLQKRYANGLSFLGSYTLSKNIGAAGVDTLGDPAGGGGFYSSDTFDEAREKSLVTYDQTHVFVFSWSYALPVGRGKRFLANTNGVVNQALGGWQFNSIETYRSGFPMLITGGPSLPIFSGYGNRPNWNPAAGNGRTSTSMGSFDPAVNKYLDITDWSQPANFTFGDGPRTQPDLRAPNFLDEGFSVFKRFNLNSESRYVEFRTEVYDLFNRVCFGAPASNINTTPTFGVITSQANNPRMIQFALKVIF